MDCSCAQIAPSAVVADAVCVIGISYCEISECLVASVCTSVSGFVGNKAAVHDFMCFSVFPLQEKVADLWKAFRCVRIGIVCLAAAPEGYLVQHDSFMVNTSVRHHSKSSVAKRKCFLPDGCRLVEPYGMFGIELFYAVGAACRDKSQADGIYMSQSHNCMISPDKYTNKFSIFVNYIKLA